MARHRLPAPVIRRRDGPLGPLPLLTGLMLALGLGMSLAGGRLPALPPEPAGLEGMAPSALLAELASADQAWIPRAESLGDGRIRYLYRRRQGDPALSLAEIQALIAVPPSFALEQQAILDLLELLRLAGVRVQLTQPRKPGAAGEWDPASRSVRIKPQLLEAGSREFARVLNHEAIHVAQSCSNGGLAAQPRPLGLSDRPPASLAQVLADPVYRQASPLEQRLEREAYANQHWLELGPLLLRNHCRLASGDG